MMVIKLENDTAPVSILQVGAGGTGSYLAEFLSQLLYSLKETEKKISYTIADGDVVEEKNLSRQKFIPADLGRHKSEVLAERYGRAHGISIGYCTEYVESIDMLRDLLDTQARSSHYYAPLPVLVGFVDNNRSRQMFHRFFEEADTLLYLDAGNEEWVGQVVVGCKENGKVLLPPVGELYPDVLEDRNTLFKSEESCTQRSEESPQNVAANILSAFSLFSVLNTVLTAGEIHTGHIVFNAQCGYARPEILEEQKD